MKEGHVKLRHRFIYKTVGGMAPLLLRGLSFRTERVSIDEPFIALSNHLTEVDMIMAGGAFAQHMYFVAGEHLLRTKFGRWKDWAQGPIYMYKSARPIECMRTICRKIKAGNNVMIFPEGSRSFNGETKTIENSVAKLVKATGGALVTFRIEGGYFAAPRWAYTVRKGPVEAHIVNIYSSSEVAAMDNEELTERINRDIYVNAYQTQRQNMYTYKGERLAEGLENYLVRCSCCGAFDSMVTEGNSFRCTECGQSGIYTEQGFLKGEGLRFDNVYDWGKWCEDATCEYIRNFIGEEPLFRDSEVTLYEIDNDHIRHDLYTGDICGYKDRIECGGEIFAFDDISGVDMLYFGKTLVFTYKKRHMAVTGEHFHAIKYTGLYEANKRGSTAAK